jgi:hypothetical protein
MVRPDAQGILQTPSGSCSFLLELDRGTERGNRLADKLEDYKWVSNDKAPRKAPRGNKQPSRRSSVHVPEREQRTTCPTSSLLFHQPLRGHQSQEAS